jgi:putative flippase GtrA
LRPSADASAPPQDDAQGPRQLAKQGSLFLVVGLVQLGLEWAAFVALTLLGLLSVPANLLARASAAGFGFVLHGAVTFRSAGGARLGRRRLVRFVVTWLASAALSTVAVGAVERWGSLVLAWGAKPLIDGSLAFCTFLVSRYWIYR